jgi:TRAP-type C4-dicarboxylate transport system permease small subunit
MRRLSRILARLTGWLLALLLAALVVVAAAETVAWTFFERSWPAASEVSGVLATWFALLGAAYGVYHRIHLGVELFTRRLPAGWRVALERVAAGLVAVFGVLLSGYGAKLAATVGNTLPATGLAASVQYLPAAFCGLLIAFFAVDEAVGGAAAEGRAAEVDDG